MDFHSTVFKGLSFHVDGDVDHLALADEIKAMGNVKDIWPINLYHTQDLKTPRQYVNGTGSNSTSQIQSTHVMGGVDKLHAEGITGEGIFVAVIDTGIAYDHPALGGGFGPGYKVAYVSLRRNEKLADTFINLLAGLRLCRRQLQRCQHPCA